MKDESNTILGAKDVRYEEVPKPEIGPDEVLIRVKATGLRGTDLEVYGGRFCKI